MAKERFNVQVYVNRKDEARVGVQMDLDDARALLDGDQEALDALKAALAERISLP